MMTKVINRHHQGRDGRDPNSPSRAKKQQPTSTSNLIDPLSPFCTRTWRQCLQSPRRHQTWEEARTLDGGGRRLTRRISSSIPDRGGIPALFQSRCSGEIVDAADTIDSLGKIEMYEKSSN
jgi:hypothetical protein